MSNASPQLPSPNRRRRVRTPFERAESATEPRAAFAAESSLIQAAREGIAEFWRELSSADGRRKNNQVEAHQLGDIVAKAMLHLYSADELIFNPSDERLFQSENLTLRQPLTGAESSKELRRAFATAAGLRSDQVDRGFQGNRIAVIQEFFRYAERFNRQPDLIIALLKGVAAHAGPQNASGRSRAFDCEVVSGVLSHAWMLVDRSSREACEFVAQLARFTGNAAFDKAWQDSLDVANRVIQMLECLDDESGETALALAALWHQLLLSLVRQTAGTQRSTNRVWLRWFSWAARGYATQLQRMISTMDSEEVSLLSQIVDRLTEFAVIARMRSVTRQFVPGSPRRTVKALLEDPFASARPLEMAWLESPQNYQQWCEAVLASDSCREERFMASASPAEGLRLLFSRGITATVNLVAENHVQDQWACWFDVAEGIAALQLLMDREKEIDRGLDRVLKVEELFVWWLVLGLVLNVAAPELGGRISPRWTAACVRSMLQCLEKIWILLNRLFVEQPGYNRRAPPAGLSTVGESTRIWIARFVDQDEQRFDEVPHLLRMIENLLDLQPMDLPLQRVSLAAEYRETFSGLVGLVGEDRSGSAAGSAAFLACPPVGREDVDDVKEFYPAIVNYWKNIFNNIATKVSPSAPLTWTQLLGELRDDLSKLYAISVDKTEPFALTDVFLDVASRTSIISRKKAAEPSPTTRPPPLDWSEIGPFVAAQTSDHTESEWKQLRNPPDVPLSQWLQDADFAFLREIHS